MEKRIFDVVVASLVLLVTAPIWPLIALLIKLGSKGPVIHRAVRTGRHGRPFVLYKFRTMRVGDSVGPSVTRAGDPRVTAVGRWLRASKLDELPNVINVLRGDMSLVGPRPEDPRYVALYTERQREVLTVRPGITSPATVAFRDEEEVLASAGGDLERAYLHEVLPRKLELDVAYVQRHSLASDLGVLAATVRAVFEKGMIH